MITRKGTRGETALAIVKTIVVAAALVVVANATPAEAGKKNFMAVLNGGQEVPPVASNGLGVLYGTLDSDTDLFCFSLTWGNLQGTESDAHIHGPNAPATESVGNIIFPIAPPLPFTGPINMCVGPLTGEQASFLKKGLLYVNVHTTPTHTAGEIRGQIFPVKGK